MKAIILFLVLVNSCAISSYIDIDYCFFDLACCCDVYDIIVGNNCSRSAIQLPECNGTRYLYKNINVEDRNMSTFSDPNYTIILEDSQYCIGRMYEDEEQNYNKTIPVAFVCFEGEYHEVITIFGILEIISVFFLVATIAVYAYLPKLRDFNGKCYMCMCLSMAIGFLGQGVMQMDFEITSKTFCSILGFFVSTWIMAGYFWMNVICINTYRSILTGNNMKRTENRQFLWSCCYAWGGPLMYLMIIIIVDVVEGNHSKPGITEECWFSDTGLNNFFYVPMAVLISVNVVLIILSLYKLWWQHDVRNSNNLNHKFFLTLKLYLVMGITWIFEIISFAYDSSGVIWTIMDSVVCLQGVVIFLVLVVLRKRVILELFKSNCCLAVTRPLAQKLSPTHDYLDDQEETLGENTEINEIGHN